MYTIKESLKISSNLRSYIGQLHKKSGLLIDEIKIKDISGQFLDPDEIDEEEIIELQTKGKIFQIIFVSFIDSEGIDVIEIDISDYI